MLQKLNRSLAMLLPLVGNAASSKEHTSGTCERRMYPRDMDVLVDLLQPNLLATALVFDFVQFLF